MFKFLFVPALVLIFCAAAAAQDWQWRTFSPPGGGWSVKSPGAMNPDEEAQESGSKMGSYAYSDFYGHFAVVYRDSKAGFWSLPPDYSSYYVKVRNDFVKASKGELLKETRYESGKRVGRDVQIKIPAGQITGFEGKTITKYRIERIRMFFVGKRFFLLLAVLPEDIVNTPAIDGFFDSFTTNTAPRAVEDLYAVDEDTPLFVNAGGGVLANDADAEDDRLSATLVEPQTAPAHGRLAMNPDGSFTYTPNANFNGQDSFTYKANDGELDSSVVKVTIRVNPVNDAPTIQNVPATATIDELTTFAFAATSSDIDSPANALRYSLSGAPAGATIDPFSGTFRFTPSEAQGPATFAFQVNVTDGAATAGATVSLTVREVNVAPQLGSVPDASIKELAAYNFAARATDADIPAQALTYSLAGAPAGATINAQTGEFSWTPTESQGNNSVYAFTVRVTDGAASAEVPVRLTATEVNSAPILATIANQTIDELTPLSLKLSATDTDDPANVLSYSLEPNAPAGMTIDARTGVIAWTPSEAQGAGDYAVAVRVTDNGSPSMSDSRTFSVRVNEVNVVPVAASAQIATNEDASVAVSLKASDADLPANTLAFSVVKAPAHGTLTGTGANLTYVPNKDFNGADSFTFKVNDGAVDSQPANVSITVAPVNDAPVASPESTETRAGVPVVVNVTANDRDVDGDALTVTSVSQAIGGTVEITGANSVRFTPNKDFRGAGGFQYTISDGKGGTAVGTVTVTVNPPASDQQ